MTKEVIIANILTILGQFVVFYASTRKDKRQILSFQIVSMLIMSLGSLLLKGYSAIVMDAVAILRNLFSLFSIDHRLLPYLFIGLSVVFGHIFNNMGWVGYFPMIANVVQSIFVLNKKTTTRQLQFVFSFASFCWAIYNIAIRAYAGMFFDLVNAISFLINGIRRKEEE